MQPIMLFRAGLFAGLLATGFGLASPAASQTTEPFFERNPLRIVVGFPAGGVYDLTARQLARFIGKHIPGNPNVIVQNMPGAGAMKAAAWFATQAPRDGSVMGALGGGAILLPLLNETPLTFDPRQLTFFGTADSGDLYCVTLTDKRASERTGSELIFGGTASGTVAGDYPWLLRHTIGKKIKVVLGYQGSAELVSAMEKEEIDGFCGIALGGLYDQVPGLMHERRARFPYVFSTESGRRAMPEAVNIMDQMSPQDAEAARFLFAQHGFIRPFAVSSSIPPDRLSVLEGAFATTLASAEFIAAMERPDEPPKPLLRDEVTKIVESLYATPPSVVARARTLIEPADR